MLKDDTKRITVGAATLELVVGSLVTEEADAIVNPAQKSLFPGGGVDGEIHQWGGPTIWEQCRELGGCETGEAKITTGGDLRVKVVIHTVGPIWSGGQAGEADALRSCYRRCLEVASENNVGSLSFPAISTGNYGYPMDEAAAVAVATVAGYLQTTAAAAAHPLELVRFVVRGRETFDAFSSAFDLFTLGILSP